MSRHDNITNGGPICRHDYLLSARYHRAAHDASAKRQISAIETVSRQRRISTSRRRHAIGVEYDFLTRKRSRGRAILCRVARERSPTLPHAGQSRIDMAGVFSRVVYCAEAAR